MVEKPKLIVTRKLPDAVETPMAALFDTVLNTNDRPFSADELAAAFGRADVIVPTVSDNVDAEIIRHAGPELKLLANFGVGVNHIDLEAAAEGLMVTNTPGVLTEDTADLAMALILNSARRLGEGERLVRGDGWPRCHRCRHRGRQCPTRGHSHGDRISAEYAHRACDKASGSG